MDIRGDEIQPMDIPKTFFIGVSSTICELRNFIDHVGVWQRNVHEYVCTGIIVSFHLRYAFLDVDFALLISCGKGNAKAYRLWGK